MNHRILKVVRLTREHNYVLRTYMGSSISNVQEALKGLDPTAPQSESPRPNLNQPNPTTSS